MTNGWLHSATASAVLLTALSACTREKGSTKAQDLATQTAPSGTPKKPQAGSDERAPTLLPAAPMPKGALTIANLDERATEALALAAYVWLDQPSCPPCPQGKKCEACPPPFTQLAGKPNTGEPADADPGPILFAHLPDDAELDKDRMHVFIGQLVHPADVDLALDVDHVQPVSPAPPAFSLQCTSDADCTTTSVRALGPSPCCPRCPTVAARSDYAQRIGAWCETLPSFSANDCPKLAACLAGEASCVDGQCQKAPSP